MIQNYSPFIMSIGPGENFAMGVFAGDVAYEAWERMTYGGIVVRFTPRDSIYYPKWLPPYCGQAVDGYTTDVTD